MTAIARTIVCACLLLVLGSAALAQTLAPRAYVITPRNANAITLSWSYYDGSLNLNGAVPVTGATGTLPCSGLQLLPFLRPVWAFREHHRLLAIRRRYFPGFGSGQPAPDLSLGLLDLAVRFSVNLKGGPAMAMPQFVKWKQKMLLGASLTVVAPTGQYDPTHLINWGINRWAFKPELGYSQRWGNWLLDAYGGVWLYTTNNAFYSVPNPQPQTQSPIGSFEGHLSYDFPPIHCWASLDGNLWFGGTTSLNGIPNPVTRQTSSRIGGTFSFPLVKHQSMKISYSRGTYVRFGGDYQTVSVAWQYSWVGWPKAH